MFKSIKFFVFFISLVLLNGCASSCGSAVDTNSNKQTNEVITPKKAENVKVPTNNNANLVNGAANKNIKNPTLDNSKVKKIDTSRATSGPPKKKMPDNSEMATESRGVDFVTTRKFLNNPQLDKIEKILNGKDVKIIVFLKNGKTYELEESKLKDFKTDSSATILEAVGVEPKTAKSDPNAKTKEQSAKDEGGK